MPRVVNTEDMRRRAARRLPRMVFDYLEGGAESERGLARNRTALDGLAFVPRRLTDVSTRDLSVPLFGKRYALPLAVAPTGLNGVLWPEGDLALARAAARVDIPFCLSTASTSTIEAVARATQGEKWFQLYVLQRDQAQVFVRRALDAGYTTLILTVDVAVNGKRERDLRSGFKVPFRITPTIALDAALHPQWSLAQLRHGFPELANFVSAEATDASAQAALMNRQMDASFDWSAFRQLRDIWPHKLLIKGLVSVEDIDRARQEGADGVILSNHGARQIEDVPSPLESLREAGRRDDFPMLIDSGFRSGSDVVKALAAGASLVLMGRTLLYGLAAAGEAGVVEMLALLRSEIDTTLALTGYPRASEIGRDALRWGPPFAGAPQ